jgi:hypothetical protein
MNLVFTSKKLYVRRCGILDVEIPRPCLPQYSHLHYTILAAI